MLSNSTNSEKEPFREPVDPDRYRIITEMVNNGVGNNALALAYGTLPRLDLAQDAVSNALEILLKMKQESFSKINMLNRYFLRITKTQALKLKTQEHWYSFVNNEDLERAVDQDAEDATDSIFNDKVQSVKLEVLITQLKPEYTEILRLFYFEDLSHREIGEILGITEDNSKMRLSRAMKALRKLYFSIHPDDDPGRGSGKKTSSAKDKNQHPRPARVPDRIKGNEILDYFMGDLKGLKRPLVERIIHEEDDLYEEVLKGYQMLSKDLGGKENVLQFLEDSRKQLLWKLKAHEHSDSDRAVNKTGASGDFGETKIVPIQTPSNEWRTNRFLFKNQERDIEFPVFQYEFTLPQSPTKQWNNSFKLTRYLVHWNYICFIDLTWEKRRGKRDLRNDLFRPHLNHLKTKDDLPVFMVSRAVFQTNFTDYSKKPNDVANDFDSCLFIREYLSKLEDGIPDLKALLESKHQYLESNNDFCSSVAVFLSYNKDGLKKHLARISTGDKFLKYKTFGGIEKEESKDFLVTTQRFLESFLIPPKEKPLNADKDNFSLCSLLQDIQHPATQYFRFLPLIITPKKPQ